MAAHPGIAASLSRDTTTAAYVHRPLILVPAADDVDKMAGGSDVTRLSKCDS